MKTFKAYDENGNAMIFTRLTEVRKAFDLTAEETSRVFYSGVHIVASGVQIITY